MDAQPEVWSPRQERYVVVAWAVSRLVAYREHEGEALDVVVFDGPGRMRVLARNATLVALDPTGRSAFLTRGPADGPPAVEIRDVARGTRFATLSLSTIDPAVGYVDYAGDWRGKRVVAATASGVAVFKVSPRKIELAKVLRVGPRARVAEPRFTGPGRITAWTSARSGSSFLDCGSAGACRQVRPLPLARGVQGFPVWRRPFYNPSRPLESR
jgi:hypothetical protein